MASRTLRTTTNSIGARTAEADNAVFDNELEYERFISVIQSSSKKGFDAGKKEKHAQSLFTLPANPQSPLFATPYALAFALLSSLSGKGKDQHPPPIWLVEK